MSEMAEKSTFYTVKRYVVEEYEVEIPNGRKLSRAEIADLAENPYAMKVLRETVVKARE
jgi:hypothetical protein